MYFVVQVSTVVQSHVSNLDVRLNFKLFILVFRCVNNLASTLLQNCLINGALLRTIRV